MIKGKLSNSIRKFIRQEKPRLHREFSDATAYQEAVTKLYQRFTPKKAIVDSGDGKKA